MTVFFSDMDVFYKLPTEIVLCILHHAADFAAVDSLLRVSPRVREIFESNARRITEDLLAGCSNTWRLDTLFRTSALIRTQTFQCTSFHEYHERTRPTPAFTKAWKDDQFSHSNTLRSMIEVAAQIQRLSCAVISTMINNLRLASDPSSILPRGWEMHGLAQSSWIEDYRVHRALWCLQVFSDLRRATSSEPVQPNDAHGSSWGGWNWSQLGIEKSLLYAPLGDMRQVVKEETQTVAHVLRNLVASDQVFFSPDDLYLPYFPSLEMNVGVNHSVWPARSIPMVVGVDTWKRGKASTCAPGIQCQVFRAIKTNLTLTGSYPCDLEDHLPLRGLGIFLWDLWRLNSMGLCSPLNKTNVKAPDGSFCVPIPAAIQNKTTQERWLWLVGLVVANGNIELPE